MFAGMAVRLAVDLGIHLEPGEEAGISHEDRRRNRLVFWSVVLLDFALSFGTGRQPSMRVSEITQGLPTDADMGTTPHPFPSAARMMLSYGRLIELLNSHSRDEATAGTRLADMHRAKLKAIREYGSLPAAMRWNVTKWVAEQQIITWPADTLTRQSSATLSARLRAHIFADAFVVSHNNRECR